MSFIRESVPLKSERQAPHLCVKAPEKEENFLDESGEGRLLFSLSLQARQALMRSPSMPSKVLKNNCLQ